MLYLFFGYAVVFVMVGVYLFYLGQRLQRLEQALKQIESKGETGKERP